MRLSRMDRNNSVSSMHLEDGSRVAILGGGPAGSFAGYFLLEICDRVDLNVAVDIFEAKDFSKPGPPGCNHCGGIVSESLVQMLASEGIVIPDNVIQRGIEAYVLHSGRMDVSIVPPVHEKRIAAIYRGAGPAGPGAINRKGLDAHLLDLAKQHGASVIQDKVEDIARDGDGKLLLTVAGETRGPYDLLIGAAGLNPAALDLFEKALGRPMRRKTTRALIYELYMGRDVVDSRLQSSMHVFLQTISNLEFAALIPKGDYATMCLVGEDLDKETADRFLASEEVTRLLPPEEKLFKRVCACRPLMNVRTLDRPFGDRIALVGDSGVTRLYKDGIGAAYRMAKSLAVTAVFQGVSARDFERFYWRKCRLIQRDNAYGTLIFAMGEVIKKLPFLRYGILRLVRSEQKRPGKKRAMSMAMWDTFTGSAPYKDIIKRMVHPAVQARLLGHALVSLFRPPRARETP